jgi:hypothetical protein
VDVLEDWRMRAFLLLFGLLAWQAPAWAQDAGAEIRAVISDQIAAFQADNFVAAFDFASPAIRRIFGDPGAFGRMVREGYPMVWHPSDVRFSGLEEQGGRMLQGVLVTDQAGELHVLRYEMIPGENGWRINGVTVLKDGDAGA